MHRSLPALTLLRTAGGIGSWLLPGTTARAFGFEHDPTHDFLNRLSGARETAFAVGPVLAHDDARRLWLRLGLACDILDTVAAAAAVRGGHCTRSQGAGLASFTVLCGLLTTTLLADGN
jgi:hypothetical protein